MEQQTPTKLEKAKTGFFKVWTIIGALALAGLALYLMGIISAVMSILLMVVIIVFCLRGIVAGLEKRGMSRGLGTTIAFLVLFLVITLFCVLMFSPRIGFGGQISDLVAHVPGYVNSVTQWVSDTYSEYAYLLDDQTIGAWIEKAGTSLAAWASTFASNAAGSVVSIGSWLINGIVNITFALIIAFWVLMDLPKLGAETLRLAGPMLEKDVRLWHITFTRVMGGYIKATLIQCGLIGVGTGILCACLGVANPAAWGLIVGTMSIVPVIGPWVGGFLAGIAGVFVAPWVGLATFGGIVVIERLVLTFLGPKILGDTVDIHPVLTLVVLAAGSAIGSALGGVGGAVVGMLICVPLAAALKALFVYYFEMRTQRQIVAEDGFFFKGVPSDPENFDPAADASAAGHAPVESGITLRLPSFGKKDGEGEVASDVQQALDSLGKDGEE